MAQSAPSVSKMAICGPRLKRKNGIFHRAKIKKLGWELKAQKCNKNPENECIKNFFFEIFFSGLKRSSQSPDRFYTYEAISTDTING